MPLDTHFEFTFYLLSSNDISFFTLDLLIFSVFFLFLLLLVLQVFEFLFCFLSLGVIRVILLFLILFVLILLCKLLQNLNVFLSGILLKAVASIMHNKDLPLQVYDVVVMKRSVRVKDKGEDLGLSLIVIPHLSLVYQPPTVDEDKTSHVRVSLELTELL
jgi:hypothetical protein